LHELASVELDLSIPPTIQTPTTPFSTLKELPTLRTSLTRLHDTLVFKNPETAILIGGDCSISLPAVTFFVSAVRKRGGKLGVIWLDAHADINTPAISPSGNLHGMVTGFLLGLPGTEGIFPFQTATAIIDPKDIVYLATRDLDDEEITTINQIGITVIRPDRLPAIDELLTTLDHCTEIYLHFDLDSLDPSECDGGQNFKVPGGTNWNVVKRLIKELKRWKRLVAMSVVEGDGNVQDQKIAHGIDDILSEIVT
jgi:arginase